MAIIKIMAKTGVEFLRGIMRLFAVVLEGVSAFTGKLGEYLNTGSDKLVGLVDKPKEKIVADYNVPM